MEGLKTTTTSKLLVLLSQYNDDYIRLMLKGTKEEFEECKINIKLIQEELNTRKQNN